ncbi:hypothetical protein [Halarchaeum salinum]|uniref:Uncharacterized protein n=1 Tax=Halarchaeum salinum TaxID=489912 RepID=A0AAV3S8U1_9EURY
MSQRDQLREEQMHRSNFNGGSPAQQIHEDILDKITETRLSEGSRDLLRNLLTKDLVLANFQEAEVNEMRWKLRAKQKLFFSMHPDRQCAIVGDDRAAIYDDGTATLRPLSDEERAIVRDLFDMLETRITRARKMKQQEMMNTTIRESRAETSGNGDESKGGLRGLLSS